MTFWSSPRHQGQAGLRYLNSLLLAGQRQGQRTGLRDCQPLPGSALGTRHQNSPNSAAFASTPQNITSLGGLEGSRQEVPVLAHPAHPACLGTTGGQGNTSFCRQSSSTRNPAGQSLARGTWRGHRQRATHLHTRDPCCAFRGNGHFSLL